MIIEEVDEIMDEEKEESLKIFAISIIDYIWENILLRKSDFVISPELKPEEKRLYVTLKGSFTDTYIKSKDDIRTKFDIKTNETNKDIENEIIKELIDLFITEQKLESANCTMHIEDSSKIHLKGWELE